ncbi:MAG: FprA family A-type flavoprotein, partial [Spirochaetaceae bacterium]|nr:FprA family A-type flavoprotein [Spirochaetaceae bacterium]
MKTQKIVDGIFAVHADIKKSRYFEGLWEIPCGVTLNSYIIQSDGVCAMIDLLREWEDSVAQYETQLTSLNLTFQNIDYLILNHLEPDHVAFLKEF